MLCNEKRYDEVIQGLKKARFHAEETDRYNKERKYCFTAPLFCYLEGDKLPVENEGFDVFEFIRCLKINRCFDPIREREALKALVV